MLKNISAEQVLTWAPRVLCILFAVFLSLLALDVFSEGYGFWETLLALVMHLIPTGLVLLALAGAWRREWIGGLLFFALGIWYIVMAWGKFQLPTYILISGPLFLIAILFLGSWLWRRKRHK